MNIVSLNKKVLTSALPGLFIGVASANAGQCPPPMFNIAPQVTTQITYDQKSKLYNYKYTIKNGPKALLPIDHFVLLLSEPPKAITAPSAWGGEFVDDTPRRVGWMSKMQIAPDGSPSSPGHIRPGQSVSGFSVTSIRPPGLIKFFAEGELLETPTSTAKPGIDEPLPDCPGFDFDGSGGEFAQKILGMAEGPSDPNVITAKIKLKGEIEELLEHQDSKHPKQAEVMVFSDDNIDVSKIDVSSVRFGMGQAQVISSKLLPIDSDDRHEDKNTKDRDEKKKESRRILLLSFDPSKIGVRCDLDLALFLTGTVEGRHFIGGAPIKKLKCKEGHEKSEHHKPSPIELGD